MLVSKEELSIEIAEINRIEVNNVDLPKAGEDEVLEQLASNASSANHQYASLHYPLAVYTMSQDVYL